MLDSRTQAWLDEMVFYSGGNAYGYPQLKEAVGCNGEWSDRYRKNFDHVLAERKLTALEYEKRAEVNFDTDAELYQELSKLYLYLFQDGPYPDGPDL